MVQHSFSDDVKGPLTPLDLLGDKDEFVLIHGGRIQLIADELLVDSNICQRFWISARQQNTDKQGLTAPGLCTRTLLLRSWSVEHQTNTVQDRKSLWSDFHNLD